jgi:hypothetical protein
MSSLPYFFGLMTTSATWMDAPLSSMVIPPDDAAGIAKAGAAAAPAAGAAAAGAASFFLSLSCIISPSHLNQDSYTRSSSASPKKREKKAALYLASVTLSMLILASFSISLIPPALPDMLIAGAAAPAAGAAAGAAAAGVFGFSFNCIDFHPL